MELIKIVHQSASVLMNDTHTWSLKQLRDSGISTCFAKLLFFQLNLQTMWFELLFMKLNAHACTLIFKAGAGFPLNRNMEQSYRRMRMGRWGKRNCNSAPSKYQHDLLWNFILRCYNLSSDSSFYHKAWTLLPS